MKKLKLCVSAILISVLVLSVVSFSIMAKAQNPETVKVRASWYFENYLNPVRLSGLINSLDKETDKSKKFCKGDESVRKYFKKNPTLILK